MKKLLKGVFICCVCVLVLGYTPIIARASVITPQDGIESEDPDTPEDPDMPEEPEREIKVLMIGNSFTRRGNTKYNVANILEELGEAHGKKINVDTVVNSGAYLQYYAFWSADYRNYYEEMLRALQSEQYDYIILQEQTKAAIEKYENAMLPAVRKLCTYIQAYQNNAKVLVYETAAFLDGTATVVEGQGVLLTKQEFQELALYGYARLQKTLGIERIQAGMQTYYSTQLYPEIEMISEDQRHPSYAGYYMAAACIYHKLYGEKPVVVTEDLTDIDTDMEKLSWLNGLVGDGIILSKEELTLAVDDSETLTAQVVAEETKQGTVFWKSLNPGIATVDEMTGTVMGIAEGTTAIICETTKGLMKECFVTVENTTPPQMSFSRTNYQVAVGDVIRLLPQIKGWKAGDTIKWSTNNSAVATVALDGTVTAKKMGKAIIKARSSKDSTVYATYNLYVIGKNPAKLSAVVTKTTANGGEVRLTWKSVYGAQKYQIYRYDKNAGYKVIGTSETTDFTDTTVGVNTAYKYKVTAMASSALTESAASGEVSAFLLGTVENQISSITKTYIKISWSQNKNATGYEIYRSEKKNSGYERIKTISQKERTYYVDKTAEKGTTYYYKIKAYKGNGEQRIYSAYSNVVKGVVLEKPELQVKPKRKYIKLTWSKNENATGYVIYRSNKKNGTYKKIKTIKKNKTTFYEDKAVKKGKTYHYKIRAYKTVAGKTYYSEYSVILNGKIPKIKQKKAIITIEK